MKNILTVIIVTYNSANCISDCLNSLQKNLNGTEIIVIDNNSNDSTNSIILEGFPHVKLVKLEKNVGYGRGCNYGAKIASNPLLLFMNPDVMIENVDEKSLVKLISSMPLGLLAPVFINEKSSNQENVNYQIFKFQHWSIDWFTKTIIMLRPRKAFFNAHRLAPNGVDGWVGGAIFIVNKQEFLSLGGFDEKFFLFYEDKDLSLKFLKAGLPIAGTKTIKYKHKRGTSSLADKFKVKYHGWAFLGWIQYTYKWEGESTALKRAKQGFGTIYRMMQIINFISKFTKQNSKMRRKANQLNEYHRFLKEFTNQGDYTIDGRAFCPDAKKLINKIIN